MVFKRWVGRSAVVLMMGLTTPLSAETITVTVHGMGEDREAAVEDALERALPEALGSEVFYVRHRAGDERGVFSTVISRGLVQSHEVVREVEAHNGVRVELRATIDADGADEPVFHEFRRWEDVAVDAALIDDVFQRIERYRTLLREFLGTPEQQFQRGYALAPRGYQVLAIYEDSVEAELLVDVVVNESWWETYYQLVGALTPVTGNLIIDGGPLGSITYNDSSSTLSQPVEFAGFVEEKQYTPVDKSLEHNLARPIVIDLSIEGAGSRRLVLHKNTLSKGAQLSWEELRWVDAPAPIPVLWYNERTLRPGILPYSTGYNMVSGIGTTRAFVGRPHENPVIDMERSEISCQGSLPPTAQVFCGTVFTVRLPVTAADTASLKEKLSNPVTVDVYPEYDFKAP